MTAKLKKFETKNPIIIRGGYMISGLRRKEWDKASDSRAGGRRFDSQPGQNCFFRANLNARPENRGNMDNELIKMPFQPQVGKTGQLGGRAAIFSFFPRSEFEPYQPPFFIPLTTDRFLIGRIVTLL